MGWQKQQLLLHLQTVGDGAVQCQYAQVHDLAILRPGLARVAGLIAVRCKLRLEMKHDRTSRDALRQLVDQKVSRFSDGFFGSQPNGHFRRQDVAKRLPVSGLVDEDEGVDAVVLLVRKTVRRRSRAEG